MNRENKRKQHEKGYYKSKCSPTDSELQGNILYKQRIWHN